MKNPNITAQDPFQQDAMTLRDYFAAKVLQGTIILGTKKSMSEACKFSYNVADSMLRERNKKL